MLHVTNISKSYGSETILSGVTFIINKGERVGLVGPNGCGKTTLLRIIGGLEQADAGQVRFDPPGLSTGYLRQALAFNEEESMAQALAHAMADNTQAWQEMQTLAEAMAAPPPGRSLVDLTAAYAEAETRFEATGGYDLANRLEIVLTGLNLADIPRDLPVARLSGGQKTRLGLAGLLIQQPQLLLLDEPTNHLDIDALDWLEIWLGAYAGAVLLVSHDRAFLDAATTRTLVIDPKAHALRDFPGNYSFYLETAAQEIDQQWQVYQGQQDELVRLRATAQRLRGLAVMKKGGKGDSGDKFAKGFFANRSARSVGRAKQIERRIENLLTEERLEKPGRHWSLKLDLAEDQGGARQVLTLEGVKMVFGERTLFSQVTATLNHGQRIALIGPNGEGKTTLLRLITGELEPTAGQVSLGKGVKPGYLSQEQEILEPASTPYEMIRAEAVNMHESDIRSFLHFFLFSGDEVFTQVSRLSFGERTRLMLALLVARGCNFLLLDEPVNHLDIPSRERFEEALNQFPGTVLAVVHDRAFMARVATGIWELRGGALKVVV